MKNFYVFLDIDGVMFDWDYITEEINAGRVKRGGIVKKFKPESVKALNYLLGELEKNYNVELVISSTWRSNLPLTEEILKANGLIFSKELDRTPIAYPNQRGKQISKYLEDKQNYDYVIIDDEMFDFEEYFSPNKIIKCEIYHSALSLGKVKNYLNKAHQIEK